MHEVKDIPDRFKDLPESFWDDAEVLELVVKHKQEHLEKLQMAHQVFKDQIGQRGLRSDT